MPNQSVRLFTASSRAVLQNETRTAFNFYCYSSCQPAEGAAATLPVLQCVCLYIHLCEDHRASEWEQVHSTDLLFQDYIRIGFMFGLRSVGKTLSDGPRTDRRVCARVCVHYHCRVLLSLMSSCSLTSLCRLETHTHRNRVRIKAGRRWFPHLPETMASHLLPAVSVSICMHVYLCHIYRTDCAFCVFSPLKTLQRGRLSGNWLI